tara:strand:+ start:1328 stop:1750 length:423 start_codon:yes stop_codon:yes gene_type:complete
MSTSGRSGAIGLDALLPLEEDTTDLFYGLTKSIKQNTKQNVKMLLLTSPGERIMFPDYGVGLRNFLFENSPESAVVSRIKRQVKRYLSNKITVVSLNVTKGDTTTLGKTGQPNTLTVELIYQINGYNIRDAVIAVETLPQ